ncbi:uncharacterized conserved protein (DUF2358) [Rubidibacter lacunae KORDI 51-2]|uniref:Uncharacterized conserved protein (DUF2358) n=1 Tax=Rubidibacter lacunae KORDI 51-2 TaxID=582515 RepID=U5DIM2_9CHRO|nr:DUF2358 domain-containing protein [Rubidibacter lacunae]ERN40792.1 uncharacterized conserved protein (DUF2358) [Rubidibacter lacunae KORDI 51-2]
MIQLGDRSNLIDILRADYQRFPSDQSFEIYAEDVYFRDPLSEFRGRDRFRQTIGFIQRWFREVRMDLHAIYQHGDTIYTDWTLNWTTPLPWQPRIAIAGRSELQVCDGLVISHIDYWHCSRLNVLRQHFSS